MKYVIYTRVSKDEQNDGTSPEHQRGRCIEYAKGKPHLLFEDTGRGWKELEKRPMLMSAIASLTKGDVLATYKPDRLSRSSETRALIKYFVRKKGATLEYVDGSPVDGTSKMDIILEHTNSMIAELERMIISERVKTAYTVKRQRGEVMGFIPYGWRKEGKKLVKHEEEQRAIQIINELRQEGLSYRSIANYMNAQGITNRKGKKWFHNAIYRIEKKEKIR